MLVASLAELREALNTAADGDTIELAPGEYQGPFLIDKSLTIRGKDRQTVLWRRGGPVLWVRAPGVKLEKLLVERTVDSDGPLIVHNPSPSTTNSTADNRAGNAPISRESKALDVLINLGELIPGSTLTLPLEIETAGRAEVAVTGLYGATVSPATVESAGKHIFWLTLDGRTLVRGEVLLGEIAVREGGVTRYLWLSGNVIDAALSEQTFCLATKKMKLYPAARGLLIEGSHLSAIEGSVTPPGRYGYIQHDGSGALFLYLPTDPPAPVLVNNHPVVRLTRVLLRSNDVVKFGNATLTVQPGEPLPIRVEPQTLTFNDFGNEIPEPAVITIHNGKAAWKGHITSLVNWINVTPEGDLRLPASRSSEWSAQLNSEALVLPDGLHEVNGGVLVTGNNIILPVDVKINVNRPEIALQIQPVDAGSLEWGAPTEQIVNVAIGNLGRGTWTGTVKSNAGWLEVITPMPVTCASWAETIVEVRLTPNWETLSIGTHDLPAGLLVETPTGNERVTVKLEVTPARPLLSVLTPTIVFDQVERNAPMPTGILRLQNGGGAAWSGTVRALNGWVRLTPSQFNDENAILAGTVVDIEVHLLDVPAELTLDTPVIIDEIRCENEDTALSVSVLLTVVELPPFLVVTPIMFAPFIKGDTLPEGMLRVYNNGPARWRGNVISNTPLLNVPDSTFSCEPGDSIELYVTLNGKALADVASGVLQIDGAFSITGSREPVTGAIYLDIREPISELHLDTPTLNFGQVDGALAELPTQYVRVVNASPATTIATIELCAEWLSIPNSPKHFDLEIHGNTIVELPIALSEEVRNLQPGVAAEERAVVITSQGKEMVVQAMLMLNEWSPLLRIQPTSLALTGETPRKLMIQNIGTHTWTLHLIPALWLVVDPIELTLETNQVVSINVSRSEISPDELSDPRAIVIVGSGREYEVEVTSEGIVVPEPVIADIQAVTQTVTPAPESTTVIEQVIQQNPVTDTSPTQVESPQPEIDTAKAEQSSDNAAEKQETPTLPIDSLPTTTVKATNDDAANNIANNANNLATDKPTASE